MKKFYAVTSCDCSEHFIITITDNKENAERIAAAYDACVEEYEDNIIDPVGVWCVFYKEYKDGETKWSTFCERPEFYGEDDVEKSPYARKTTIYGKECFVWSAYVFAKDRNHAIKAGQDRYAQWKAEQEGIV